MFNKMTIKDVDVTSKRLLIRVDFNVPVDDRGNIIDDTRIRAALKTINYALDRNARIILMSHLGRPKGKRNPKFSLKPVAIRLSRLLNKEVIFVDDCIGDKVKEKVNNMKDQEVILLENLRFHKEETENDENFAKELASLGDIYVNDAFATAHRKHASTYGITKFIKPAVMGFLMLEELEYFSRALENPKRPLVAILGGAKVSSKIGIIKTLLNKVDKLLIGGAMAFTFLKALGYPTGTSLVEEDYIELAANIFEEAKEKNVKLYTPVDFILAKEIKEDTETLTKPYKEIPDGWMGLDIGPATVVMFKEALSDAKTVVWNGPLGVFEVDRFKHGTLSIAKTVASLDALTIAGGGDTDAALNKAGVREGITYVSTGGGAFMELLEKGTLPCVEVLTDKEA